MDPIVVKNRENYNKIVACIKKHIKYQPSIGIICGSGLGEIGDRIKDSVSIKYTDIPGFLLTSTLGHKGVLICGTMGGKNVICMQGRFHPYEGYDAAQCAGPIRVMQLLGVNSVILTGTAGALNSNYKLGDIMIIIDHICVPGLAGLSPLKGPNDDRFGPRFPVMQGTYSHAMRRTFKEVITHSATKLTHRIKEGVYAMIGGPSFATNTESNFLKATGADAVGMSVVWEATLAHHCAMKVLALAIITDLLADHSDKKTLHDQVVEEGQKIAVELVPILEAFCKKI